MNEWTYLHHVMKTRVAQRVGLMLGTLVQVCVADDGTGGVHSIFLVLHQQGKGKRNDRVLGGHKAFPHSVTRRINSTFPYIRTNRQSTSTSTRRLNVRGMLPVLGSMRGLGQQAPTWGFHGCGSLLDFLLFVFYCLLILCWLHLWNRRVC